VLVQLQKPVITAKRPIILQPVVLGFIYFLIPERCFLVFTLAKALARETETLHPWIYEIKFDRYRALAGSLP
jgi:hypothetical protein